MRTVNQGGARGVGEMGMAGLVPEVLTLEAARRGVSSKWNHLC